MVEDFWVSLLGVILRLIAMFIMVRYVIPKQVIEWRDRKTDLRIIKTLLLLTSISILFTLIIFSSYQIARLSGVGIITHYEGELSLVGSLNNLFVVLILYYLYNFK